MKKILSSTLIGILFFSGFGAVAFPVKEIIMTESINDDGTEYWALLVGVSKSKTKPWNDHNEPAISTIDLYDQLLKSDHWQPDHIRVLTGKNASWLNIYRGLKWLAEMDDEDDICLFYITTHGGQGYDVFPKDEEDGLDEFLIVYDSDRIYFPKIGLTIHIPPRFFYLYDDDVNYMLSKLDAKGVCAIIDTCHSGGFSDPPKNSKIVQKFGDILRPFNSVSSSNWNKEFAEEIAGSGRVVLAASAEDKLSQSYGFIHYLLEGLQGYGDIDSDNKCSAEEAFNYAAPKYEEFCSREMDFLATPQIYDDYTGELHLTDNEFPPYPTNLTGPRIGTISTEYEFVISAQDPEEDSIRYYMDWGDGYEENTDLYPSGESVNLLHNWGTIGTYNIWFDSKDENGVSKWWQTNFPDHITMTITDEHPVDQMQTLTYEDSCGNDGLLSDEVWLAQSFIPENAVLSMVDLEIWASAVYSDPTPIYFSIKDDLKGDDLTCVSVMPQQIYNHMIPEAPKSTWTTFDFSDIEVSLGETYYIVIHCEGESVGGCHYAGVGYEHDLEYTDDPYPDGNVFISKNRGDYWRECSIIQDLCFVTYGG